MADRFLIAPYDANSGLRTDVKPWLIPNEAFSFLQNAYVFRGRVRKRFGTKYLDADYDVTKSQLRQALIGVFGGANTVVTTPSNLQVGQTFLVNNVLYTITTITPPGFGNPLLKSNPAAPNAQVTSANTVTFFGVDFSLSLILWYPHLPVMGFVTKESDTVNDEQLIAFDTKYAYLYANGWSRLNLGQSTWSGTDINFFWSINYLAPQTAVRYIFTTNFDLSTPISVNAGNRMRYLVVSTLTWNDFTPQLNSVPDLFIKTARVLVVFHNRLLALNVQEYNSTTNTYSEYPNRCRFSRLGDATGTDAFEDKAGAGGFIDAYTTEEVVTTEFVKDRLIVYFERSTWELAYTGNEIRPFQWQQLNTELGAESTFSIIPFDRVAIGIGQTGIHACNGSNVERIDQKIPETVFSILDADEFSQRVCGIRDYFIEALYWSIPTTYANGTNFNGYSKPYPAQVLFYNYVSNTWALFDDSITAFGYYQQVASGGGGTYWDTPVAWDSGVLWDSVSTQSKFRSVVAGNQQGYTFICDTNLSETEGLITITNITAVTSLGTIIRTITAYNHNFTTNDYVLIAKCTGDTAINLKIYEIQNTTQNTFQIYSPLTEPFNTYTGAGRLYRVPRINITTKQFNFYGDKGRNTALNKVDFLVSTTSNGEIDVNYYASTNDTKNLLEESELTGALLGTGTLETKAQPNSFEVGTERVWHPVYLMGEGEVVQLQLTFNDAQMREPEIWASPFELHAMVLYTDPTSFRYQ